MNTALTRARSNSATTTTPPPPPVPRLPSKLSSGSTIQPPPSPNPTSSSHPSIPLSSSSSSKSKSKSKSTNLLSSRMSILPSKAKLQSLALGLGRRQQADVPPSSFASSSSSSDPNLPPPNTKTPLLTLSFSSRSFLDSIVIDADTVKEKDKEPLYVFNTVGTSTTISRRDGSRSSSSGKDNRHVKEREVSFHKMASVKWPRALPTKMGRDYTDGVLIQMKNARWYGGETLLKLGSNPNASRRFSIPNYSHPMKWKRYGHTYWCTTPSVKGPIATLSTAKSVPSAGPFNTHPNLHPQPNSHSQQPGLTMTIYETLHDKYDPNALTAFRGVSILLLDYLLVTAMLLVTDLQEWMLVRKADDHEAGQAQGVGGGSMTGEGSGGGVGANMGPGVDGQGSVRGRGGIIIGQSTAALPGEEVVPFRSDARIRKIMYGEPIFPKGAGPAAGCSGLDRDGEDHEDDEDETQQIEGEQSPPTPPTPGSGAGMPTFLSRRGRGSITTGTLLPSMTDSSEDEEDDDDDVPSEYHFEDDGAFVSRARAESVAISSPTSAGGPTHTALDPSFYYPPVPPIPLKYAKSFTSLALSNDGSASVPTRALSASTSASQPSTPLSGSFGASTSASSYNNSFTSSSTRPPIPPIPPLPSSLPPFLQNVDPISRPRSSPPLQAHQHDSTHSRTHSQTNTNSSPSSPSRTGSYSPRSDSLHHGHHVQTTSTLSTSSGSHYGSANRSDTHSPAPMSRMARRESVRSYGSAASASASTSASIHGSGSGVGVATAPTKRPLPRPPPLPSPVSGGANINIIPPTATAPTAPRPQRSLPPTPGFALSGNDVPLATSPPPLITSSPPPSSPTDLSHPPSHPYPSNYTLHPNVYPYPYPYPFPPPNPNSNPNAAGVNSAADADGIQYAYAPYAFPYPYVYPVSPGATHPDVHARQPPITKASQEDLASYVHLLTTGSVPAVSSGSGVESTSPGRGDGGNEGGAASAEVAGDGNRDTGRQERAEERQLPVEPIPSSSIYDVPPPAYNTIVFGGHPPHAALPPPVPPGSTPGLAHPSVYPYAYPYPLAALPITHRQPVQVRSMSMPDTSLPGASGPGGQRLAEVDRGRERRPTAPELSLMGLGAGSGSGLERDVLAEVQEQPSPPVGSP